MKDWLNFPIKDLQMTTSGKRVLMHEGYETLGDLEKMTDAELLQLPNFGRESLWQFRNAQLAVRGSHVQITHSISLPLRDWFAGQALAGLSGTTDERAQPAILAKACYLMADAMLEARETEE